MIMRIICCGIFLQRTAEGFLTGARVDEALNIQKNGQADSY
jgi:hypothetical protein